MGQLGGDQLRWLDDDLKFRGPSTPIVIFAHVPLWTVYPALAGTRFERAYREAVSSGRPVEFEAPYTGQRHGCYEVRA